MKSDEKITGTKATLAEWLGVAPTTIDSYIANGIVERSGRVFDIKGSVVKVVSYFRELSVKKSSGEGDALKNAKIEETILKARKLELEIAEMEKELINSHHAQAVYAQLIRSVAVWVDKIPDSMERKGIIPKEGVETLRQECDAMRQTLHDELNKDDVFTQPE